jgi:hypothetical protein
MSISSIIDNLRIKIQPTWSKNMGVGANESHNKVRKSNLNLVSGRDNNINGDVVLGAKHVQQKSEKHPFVEISLGMRNSNLGRYTVEIFLRNIGKESCTLQKLKLADEEIVISKKSLAPTDKAYAVRQDITNYKIRTQIIDNPLALVKYRDLSGGLYTTTAKIIQSPMVVGTFNIDEIEDNEFHKLLGEQK